jgi:1-deoxy-D-xylulose-5-phosphate synthase
MHKINICPELLRNATVDELIKIAATIRSKIIETVAQTGGHLAPSLGVVELTLALHSVFNTPQDKLIWDVGHQAYAHKIITGRSEQFGTLRQYGGLSGFPKRSESHYDTFETGHSSTSISAAVGMALARDLKKEKYQVVAVIGDGALTGGMAFEALNHAGHLGVHLTVVLNDNEMSIAPNVGAISDYLSRIRTEPIYSKGKEEIELILKKLPTIGDRVFKIADKLKDGFKYLIIPGILFEELGFTYLGPIDGHNIQLMQKVLERAKRTKGPVLVHVITKKGKGYEPAELNPNQFHGIGPFDISSGKILKESSIPTYTDAFSNKLVELGSANKKIVGITAAMPDGTGLSYFAKKYPERFFDVGIAEQHAVTLGAGLASSGFKPVIAIYSTFLQRAFDQILHDVCMQNLPVLLAIDRAGLVGEDGDTHQGVFDISFLRPIPNLTIIAPKDENELEKALEYGIELNSPVAIRFPRGSGVGPTKIISEFTTKSEILKQGHDIAIFAVGPIVYTCLQAAEILQDYKINASVINARFVKPLDKETINKFASQVRLLVTVEEHVVAGGYGSAVQEAIHNKDKPLDILRIGISDHFVPHGSVSLLREKLGLTPEKIADKIYNYWQRLHRNKVTY